MINSSDRSMLAVNNNTNASQRRSLDGKRCNFDHMISPSIIPCMYVALWSCHVDKDNGSHWALKCPTNLRVFFKFEPSHQHTWRAFFRIMWVVRILWIFFGTADVDEWQLHVVIIYAAVLAKVAEALQCKPMLQMLNVLQTIQQCTPQGIVWSKFTLFHLQIDHPLIIGEAEVWVATQMQFPFRHRHGCSCISEHTSLSWCPS